jgi:hypothetical protein
MAAKGHARLRQQDGWRGVSAMTMLPVLGAITVAPLAGRAAQPVTADLRWPQARGGAGRESEVGRADVGG